MNRFLILLTMLLMPLLALGQSTAVLDGIGLANGKSYTNYIKNPNAQKNTVNVTASNLTLARSITTPLYSAAEFNLTSTSTPWSATWSALAFNEGMKNRLCEVQIMLRGTAAGTTTLEVLQNSVAVFTQTVVLDATNPKKYGGTFPCGDLTYASTVKLGGTGATTGAIEAGAVYLGEPVSVSSGAVVTEWQSYTPTFEGLGTVSGLNAKYRRVGSNLEGEFAVTGGTHTASLVTISLPSGLTMSNNGIYTVGVFGTTSTPTDGRIDRSTSSDTKLFMTSSAVSTTLGSAGTTWSNGTVFGGSFSVPISGWAATDIVTPEQSLPSIARTYRSGSGLTITAGTPLEVIFNTERNDTKNEFNTSTGRFTAQQTGWYAFDYGITLTCGATAPTYAYYGVMVNGAGNYLSSAYITQLTNSKTVPTTASGIVYLTAGQYISVWANTAGQNGTIEYSSNEYSYFHVRSASNPGSQSFYIQGPTKGGNSGNAIPTGYVGEKVAFTAATISATTGSWVANATPLYTLPAGRWQVVFYGVVTAATSATMAEFTVASNSSNDSTGFFSEGGTTVLGTANTNGVTSGAYRFSAPPLTLDVTTTQALYAKATTEGANRTVVVRGYAIRLD